MGNTPGSGFRSDIQGLRAVAVCLVLLFHAGVPFLKGGYIGVDVFFVISGYLITTHLAENLRCTGRIDFLSFYSRRIRRIVPVSLFVLAVSTAAALIWMPPLQAGHVVRDAIATALYVPNILLARSGTNYLAEQAPSPLQHYWSLGVEEQFYLFWPLALFAVWRACRASVGRTMGATALLTALSFVACIWLTARLQPWAFFGLPTRAWELGAGALVALLALNRRPTAFTAVGSWLGLALILGSAVSFDANTAFPGYAAVVPVLGTALVIWFGLSPSDKSTSALLSTRPAQWLGTLSYSLYLWHWPLLVIPAAAAGEHLSVWTGLALTCLAVPLSMWSYRYVETPLRIGSPGFEGRKVVIGAASASAMLVAIFFGAGVMANLRPSDAGRLAPAFVASVPPQSTAYVPSNITPALRAADKDTPSIYAGGCHNGQTDSGVKSCVYGDENAAVAFALFGDSHAAQWFPALESYARKAGIRLHVYTKSACPSADVVTLNQTMRYLSCEAWRKAVVEQLKKVQPDVILIANFRAHQLIGQADSTTEWNAGLRRTLTSLPPGSKAVVIGDTPQLKGTPAICLSANLQDTAACARPRSEAVDGAWQEAERYTTVNASAAFIDMNRYLCTDICSPVLGNLLVYRDRDHLSVSASAALADVLGREIETAIKRVPQGKAPL